MAEPHAHSQPIQTYGPAPHNRNIWPHNSRATVFCLRFWPILLFALVPPVYPLLPYEQPSLEGKANTVVGRNLCEVISLLDIYDLFYGHRQRTSPLSTLVYLTCATV